MAVGSGARVSDLPSLPWDVALNAANRYRHVLYGIAVALHGVSIAVVKGYHRYQQSNELRHRHRHNNYRVHFCV